MRRNAMDWARFLMRLQIYTHQTAPPQLIDVTHATAIVITQVKCWLDKKKASSPNSDLGTFMNGGHSIQDQLKLLEVIPNGN